MNESPSISVVEPWSAFEANWLADRVPCLMSLFERATEGYELETVLVPDAVYAGRLTEVLSQRSSWVACLSDGPAAERMLKRELPRDRVQNVSVTTGSLDSNPFADETFDQAVWLVPSMLSVHFRQQLAELRRTIRTSGIAILLVMSAPHVDSSTPATEIDAEAERARIDDLVQDVASATAGAFPTLEMFRYSGSSEAPSMEAFLSATFRATQPRGADLREVERTLTLLKRKYDGGMLSLGPVGVVARGAAFRAFKR